METTTKLPAGIMDPDMEFFELNGDVSFLQDGKKHYFSELDFDTLILMREDLEKYPKAIMAMEELNITDPIGQLKRWALCRFGNFDNRADITEDGVIIHEYVNCSSRGRCKYEGILCMQKYPAEYGNLTPREIEVIKMVIQDLPDKIIADRLGISVHTMAVHRTNIERKIGCSTKVGITAFAYQNNLI